MAAGNAQCNMEGRNGQKWAEEELQQQWIHRNSICHCTEMREVRSERESKHNLRASIATARSTGRERRRPVGPDKCLTKYRASGHASGCEVPSTLPTKYRVRELQVPSSVKRSARSMQSNKKE